MVQRIATLLFLLCVAGCKFAPDGTDTDKLRDVLVPGYQTPSRISYHRANSAVCRSISRRSIEIAERPAEHRPFLSGYSQVRVDTPDGKFRAFFKPDQIEAAPYEASFIFCINDSTPISTNCSVVGVTKGSCFYTGYDWYKLSEIDSLIRVIRKNAPTWGGT